MLLILILCPWIINSSRFFLFINFHLTLCNLLLRATAIVWGLYIICLNKFLSVGISYWEWGFWFVLRNLFWLRIIIINWLFNLNLFWKKLLFLMLWLLNCLGEFLQYWILSFFLNNLLIFWRYFKFIILLKLFLMDFFLQLSLLRPYNSWKLLLWWLWWLAWAFIPWLWWLLFLLLRRLWLLGWLLSKWFYFLPFL